MPPTPSRPWTGVLLIATIKRAFAADLLLMQRDVIIRSTSHCTEARSMAGSVTTGAGPISEATAAMPRIVYVYLAVIVVTWAGNWPLMRLALDEAPPIQFVLLRLVGTLALLAPMLLLRGSPLLPVRGERLGLLWVGNS